MSKFEIAAILSKYFFRFKKAYFLVSVKPVHRFKADFLTTMAGVRFTVLLIYIMQKHFFFSIKRMQFFSNNIAKFQNDSLKTVRERGVIQTYKILNFFHQAAQIYY